MTEKEIMDKFGELYTLMAASDEPEHMRVFGGTMKEMLRWIAESDASAAEGFVEKLCAIKWDNFLTLAETKAIIGSMSPQPVWSKDEWAAGLDALGIVREESPYYNDNALFVTMSMVYSDSAATIARLLGKTLADATDEEMLKATHAFALDKLKDKDGRFDVRAYFGL